ncbi:MAG: beta galactosidase jelly roll domain-containing protein [Saprospiraceae bacterium]|nr:beta galactosidase jelly roll domain-containing protein [Saprospiraceae bacterium]
MKLKSLHILTLGLLMTYAAAAQNTMSLNGQWDIIFDSQNEGREAGWMQAAIFEAQVNKETIQVPAAWERYKKDYEGVAFYRKQFKVPQQWDGKVVRLQFGAVNYLTEVWLNDEVVGFHEGGFTPFEFRVDEMIKAGSNNVLTLRVVGPIILSDQEIDGMKKMEVPQWRGGITGGIWQSVQLVATEAVYVKDVYIIPNIRDNTARFQIDLDHTGIEALAVKVDIAIKSTTSSTSPTTVSLTQGLRPGNNQVSPIIRIPDAKYWSPDEPNLYRATVTISYEDKTLDQWSDRFGMRELTIRDKDFYLNGKRIYIKASFFEGLYPNGIAYPDSKEMARREIQLAKAAGFNMIRPWRRPPAPMWLDLADEMGVLVVGSPALECMTLPVSTPYLPKRVEHEVKQSILRDRNRACIVQWELFNELHRPVLKQLMRPMAMLARELDPSRLILDESGGWAYGANMYLPGEFEPTKFNDIHNYPGPFINEQRYNGYLSIGMTAEEKKKKGWRGPTPGRNVVPNLMSYVSELGYGSLPDMTENIKKFERYGNPLTPAYRYHKRLHEGQKKILQASGFAGLYPDMKQYYLDQQQIHGSANKRMIEAVRANPAVDGYCIHALAAGDWILGAGLIDLWRQPKSYAYEGTKAANQPQIVSIRVQPRNIYAEQGGRFEIIGINDLESENVQLQLELINSKGKVVFRSSNSMEWQTGVSTLLQDHLDTKSWNGNYTVKVRINSAGGQLLTTNSYTFDVFKSRSLRFPRGEVALFGEQKKLQTFLEDQNVRVTRFSSNTSPTTPVLVPGTLGDNPEQQGDFPKLFEFIRGGGTAVYLEGADGLIETESFVFPFTAKAHPAVGLWTCIPHLVHDHPLFRGLPSDGPMRDIYENVWARKTLRDLRGEEEQAIETVVGSMGFDWFSKGHKMHYSGPGEAWWGSDVAILPMGTGKVVVSQLRLLPNLGTDPVADKIMANLLQYLKVK